MNLILHLILVNVRMKCQLKISIVLKNQNIKNNSFVSYINNLIYKFRKIRVLTTQ